MNSAQEISDCCVHQERMEQTDALYVISTERDEYSKERMVMTMGKGITCAVVVVSLLTLAIIACGGTSDSHSTELTASVDVPVYTSIEELSSTSGLVILGTVEGVVAREIDYGTADPDERQGQGIPTVFYEVAVTETLRGKAGATIIVAGPDVDEVSMPSEATALRQGQQVLLFLEEQTPEMLPV